MLDLRKRTTIQKAMQIYIPDLVGGGDLLVGQVAFTIENGTASTMQKDIWNEDVYVRFKDAIEEQIFLFEQECKAESQELNLTVEPKADNVMIAEMLGTLRAENDELKTTVGTLKQQNDELSQTVSNIVLTLNGGANTLPNEAQE